MTCETDAEPDDFTIEVATRNLSEAIKDAIHLAVSHGLLIDAALCIVVRVAANYDPGPKRDGGKSL